MKRKIYLLYIILVQLAGFALQSCDDELADINRNPNATEIHSRPFCYRRHSIMLPTFTGGVLQTIIRRYCGRNIGRKYNIRSRTAIT